MGDKPISKWHFNVFKQFGAVVLDTIT